MNKLLIEQQLNEKKSVVVSFKGVEAQAAPKRETRYVIYDRGLEVSLLDDMASELERYDDGTAEAIISLIDGVIVLSEEGVIARSHDSLLEQAIWQAKNELGL